MNNNTCRFGKSQLDVDFCRELARGNKTAVQIHLQCARQRSGFTLVELLAVMAVIILLAGLVMGLANLAKRTMAVSQTKAEIARMCLALEAYKADFGYYPILNINSVHYPPSAQNATTNQPACIVSNNFYLLRALVSQGKTYLTFKPRQLSTNWANAWSPGPWTNSFGVSILVTNIMDPFGTPYNYPTFPG